MKNDEKLNDDQEWNKLLSRGKIERAIHCLRWFICCGPLKKQQYIELNQVEDSDDDENWDNVDSSINSTTSSPSTSSSFGS